MWLSAKFGERLGRRVGAVVVAIVAVLGIAVVPASPARAEVDSGSEAQFVSMINGLRASQGLAPLIVDGQLTAIARDWAATMAASGTIFHRGSLSSGVSGGWSKLGENVGMGSQGDVGGIHQAFVNSPSHYQNLVDPAFTRIGVGVYVQDGMLYTAHEFMAATSDVGAAPAPSPEPTPAAAPAPSAQGASAGGATPVPTDPAPPISDESAPAPAPVPSAAMTSVLSGLRRLDARF